MDTNHVQPGCKAAPDTFFISVQKDGPYLVYGQPPINEEIITPDAEGHSWTYTKGESTENCGEPIALCRCGHSAHKPCCDGAHAHVQWDSKETATKEAIFPNTRKYEGVDLLLNDNKKRYCAIARFCDNNKDIWELMEEPLDEEKRKTIERMATYCPSGRLILVNKTTGKIYEPDLDPSIGILEDPVMKVSGPIWVKGGIRVQSADGSSYEIRNRVTLCRCGHSKNKPFCDGAHVKEKFNQERYNK
ncbi:CDGSH iron-sulfur domain-containing protein [Bacteroidales bacterium OttesenSCG-928-A17]|nr:CDGSH iron-sulfur domain-containing protein [Bacteroidales bacterium OttesenSCG-928-A17]